MVHRHCRLPSLTALAAFESAARHRSVQRAADELNVAPGAVSRQIRALEAGYILACCSTPIGHVEVAV